MEYNVKLSSFEGPFDLLLHLVERAQVDISEISIGDITEDFLKVIESIEVLDLETTSEFLVVAATLIDIKSRTLLPTRNSSVEEGFFEEDPRQQLIRRLLEYKKYKEVSQVMLELANTAENYHTRAQEVIEPQYKPVSLSLNQLFNSFQRVMEKAKNSEPPLESQHHIKKEEITIGQQMNTILTILEEKNQVTFNAILGNHTSRYHIVISFLSILELIRLKKITVIQQELLGEITLVLKGEVA